MFTAGGGHLVLALGLLHNPPGLGRGGSHLGGVIFFVSGQRVLRVGFVVPRLVTLPRFLNE